MGFLRVFIQYCTKSLRNFTVLLWWWSNLQDSRLFDWARCASNKMDNFIRRKKFGAKKLQKNGFFGVFTHYCTESLRNFTLALRWFSNLQDSRPFEFERCASYKKGNFIRKKIKFGRENFKKWVFWGFSDITALNRFAILLRCCDDDQASRIVAYLIEQGAPVIKWTTLSEEK